MSDFGESTPISSCQPFSRPARFLFDPKCDGDVECHSNNRMSFSRISKDPRGMKGRDSAAPHQEKNNAERSHLLLHLILVFLKFCTNLITNGIEISETIGSMLPLLHPVDHQFFSAILAGCFDYSNSRSVRDDVPQIAQDPICVRETCFAEHLPSKSSV